MTSDIHISLAAEKIFEFAGFPMTNSLLTTWVVMTALIIFSILICRKLTLVPGFSQSVVEIIIDGFYQLFSSVIHEKINLFFPFLVSIFIFIVSLNWVGLLPGMGTIGIYKIAEGHREFVPLFRAGTADLNTTLALAVIAVLVIQYSGFKTLGAAYLGRFFNFRNPVYFFVGILELISDFAKVISFAFRLFGNIFAGEVLLTVIAFLMPLFAPLPFLGLELFVGFIQALVFSMLTAVFLSVAQERENIKKEEVKIWIQER
ncbi:F0F1 ATP synthase subunit A [Candidatus Gottesmanbacteria bacterium]|nr:F0F1 ATP synthase subunit A [Candidatus Gottesmanbacteria bacterium]